MGTNCCAKVKPSFFLLSIYYRRGRGRDCWGLPAAEPSWAGCLRDACTALGLGLRDQGDKLLLALEQFGAGKKRKGETHGKHQLQGGILERSLRKREGEAAARHGGDDQWCSEKREGRGGRAEWCSCGQVQERGRARSQTAAWWLRHLFRLRGRIRSVCGQYL